MFEPNCEYYLWGAGTYGTRLIEFMKKDMTFKAVIDNNPAKQGTQFHGLPVISYEDAKQNLPEVKVVIAQVYPNIVRDFLLREHYVEYVDFVSIYDFIPRYFWKKKAQLVPKVANFAPTNFCSLDCEYCQSFMQYGKHMRTTPIEELINDVDLLFQHIDSIFLINLCCGESFLNKNLSEFVKYVFDKYSERYGSLVILTNGTIIPSDAEMSALSETNAVLSISDYSEGNPKIKDSLERLTQKCKQYGVKYYLNTSSDKDAWFDLGNPLITTETQPEKLKLRYNKCFKPGNGVRDGKMYICQSHNVALAVAGASQPETGDYFDLRQPKTEQSIQELLKIICRVPDRGYVEHCKSCNGTTPISERDE